MFKKRYQIGKISRNDGNNQLLYFTTPSISKDGRNLVFISDRTGSPNLFIKDLLSAEERQLTHNEEGVLRAYQYFYGKNYKGFGMGSPSFDPVNKIIYYLHGRNILCVDLKGNNRILAQYPKGQMTAYTSLSKDGTRLCVPTVDEEAFDGIKAMGEKCKYIDKNFRKKSLNAYLRIYDTKTGEEIYDEKVNAGWITHVQFSPKDNNFILYNHEWADNWGIRRIWLWDGKKHMQLRTLGDGRYINDFVCHEMWEPYGNAIIYHGRYRDGKNKGKNFIGRIDVSTGKITEIPLKNHNKGYGHFISGGSNLLVTDGYFWSLKDRIEYILRRLRRKIFGTKLPSKFNKGFPLGIWISVLKVNWKDKKIKWTPICRHDTKWKDQDDNPHPFFDNERKDVYFTSDKDGLRAIYKINIPYIK